MRIKRCLIEAPVLGTPDQLVVANAQSSRNSANSTILTGTAHDSEKGLGICARTGWSLSFSWLRTHRTFETSTLIAAVIAAGPALSRSILPRFFIFGPVRMPTISSMQSFE